MPYYLGTSGRIGLATSPNNVSSDGVPSLDYLIYYDSNGGERRAVGVSGPTSTSDVVDGALRISGKQVEIGYSSDGHWKGAQGTQTGGGGTNGKMFIDNKDLVYVDNLGNERAITGDKDFIDTSFGSSALTLTDRYDGIAVELDNSVVQEFGKHLIGQYDVYRKTTDDGTLEGYSLIKEDSSGNFVDTNVQENYTYTYKLEFVLFTTDGKKTTTTNEPSLKWTNPDDPISGTPSGITLSLGNTCDLEGQWQNPNSYGVECELQTSTDASNWSTVTNSSGYPILFQENQDGSTSTNFDCFSTTRFNYYRFRARYINSTGIGDWSGFSGNVRDMFGGGL